MTGTERDTTTPTRGLVLGGGGVAGIAWETGLLSGLLAAGVDLGAADAVVGTSAGSVVAINLRAGAIDAAYDEHFVDVAGMAEPMGSRDLARTVEVIGEGVASTAGEIPTRQRIGELALEEYDPEVDDAASVERAWRWRCGGNSSTNRSMLSAADTVDIAAITRCPISAACSTAVAAASSTRCPSTSTSGSCRSACSSPRCTGPTAPGS